ncbi:MAG: hypothetical protein HY646_18790 [Acidobacteria bacterium]|nr:hypothetical protein [Acidobacteriota bacterium]
MERPQLEHIIRAAAAITGADEFVVIGSQAVLGQFPNPPAELLVSIEADLFTFRRETDAELIDGSIGEFSPFHQTFGYYAHGVGEETAVLPSGWKERLIPIQNENTGGGTGLCLEIHDLAVSKLAAGRQKDLRFVDAALRHHLADPRIIRERLMTLPLTPERRDAFLARLDGLSKPPGQP